MSPWQLLRWLQVVRQTGLRGIPLMNPLPSLQALSVGGEGTTVHQHCSAQSCSCTLSCIQNQLRTMHIIGVSQRSWAEFPSLGGKYKRKTPPIEVYMEPFHAHTMDNSSLSICAYLHSVLVKDQDANATGLSLPSGTFQRTAPMPVGEASHASLTGNTGS